MTRYLSGIKPPINASNAVSMVWMRCSSGLSSGGCLALFLLPFGRPGLRFSAGGFFSFRALALALQAAFSSAERTTCSTRMGLEQRLRTLTSEKTKKANPGIARWKILEKMQSFPNVAAPALLTTTSSPVSRYSSPGCQRSFTKNDQKIFAQGSSVEYQRWMVR